MAELPKLWENEDAGPDGPHATLTQTLQSIRNRQQYRIQSDWLSQQLYADLQYIGYSGVAKMLDWLGIASDELTENVLKSIIDTLHAKLDKIRVMPVADVIGGDFLKQMQAEQINQYLAGRFHATKAWNKASRARLHGLIVGTGLVKVFHDGKSAQCETTPAPECWVDPSEARYGEPLTFWQTKAYDRQKLIEDWADEDADNEELILKAAGVLHGAQEWDSVVDTSSDMVYVAEVWHLGAKGRHVIFLDNCTLLNERWKRDHFPFATFRWGMRSYGYWVTGICEEMRAQQMEYNYTMQSRQTAIRLLSAPYVSMPKGSTLKTQWNNLIGRIMTWTGTEPKIVAPEPIGQGLLDHGDRVKRGMFETSGVSSLSAMMQKPAGLNSGKAIRNYVDLESERFIRALRESEEQLVLRMAELMLEEEHENGRSAVLYESPEGVERVEFPDIKRDEYVLRIAPTSELSQDLPGRIQDIYDLKDLGAVTDPGEIRELLSLSNLKRSRDLQLAHRDLIRQVIELKILRDGIYVEPEPFWDLDFGKQYGMNMLARAQLRDAPADRIELLRKWVLACIERSKPPAPQPAPPGPEQPESAPMAAAEAPSNGASAMPPMPAA